MICFQLLIFVFLNTTLSIWHSSATSLWFAFNFWSLYFWTQPWYLLLLSLPCCDLLSTFDLCIFEHNSGRKRFSCYLVVICFQLLIFVFLNTTEANKPAKPVQLWFAFNFWSLYFWTQLVGYDIRMDDSCDLLSTFDLCIFEHNRNNNRVNHVHVVICFQLLIFVFLNTTSLTLKRFLL